MSLVLFAAIAVLAPEAVPMQFPLGDRVLTGSGAGKCLIEGTWRDGASLKYQAWDACAKLSVRAVARAEIASAVALGRDKTTQVSDIPAGAEVIAIANDVSSVIVFRDAAGRQREILVGD